MICLVWTRRLPAATTTGEERQFAPMGHRFARLALVALSAAWKRVAAAGSIAAMNAIASLHAGGEDVRPDAALAVAWYRRAAQRGDAVAQLNLGNMYSRGNGVRHDPIEAYLWLGIAAKMTAADIGRAESRIAAWTPQRMPAAAELVMNRDP